MRVVVSTPPYWCAEGWPGVATPEQTAARNERIDLYARWIEELAGDLDPNPAPAPGLEPVAVT